MEGNLRLSDRMDSRDPITGYHVVSGRVEICFNGEWSAICDNDWDVNDARVGCNRLGFPTEEYSERFPSHFSCDVFHPLVFFCVFFCVFFFLQIQLLPLDLDLTLVPCRLMACNALALSLTPLTVQLWCLLSTRPAKLPILTPADSQDSHAHDVSSIAMDTL